MKNLRIIPRLDIKGPNLVKGVHLEGLRVLGKPSDFARHYYENGADELVYMDVVASLYGRNGLHDLIRQSAKELSIPLLVGGGIRTIQDIQDVLRSGADKVSINTAAISDPKFLENAVKTFGSSTIVVAIEAIRESDGRYLAYTNNGREYTGKEAVSWAKELESIGVGEIIITSVDREGTGKGFEQDLISKISGAVSIPLIAHGGAASEQDVLDTVKNTKVDAVSIASSFHYEVLANNRFQNESQGEGNTDFLKSGRSNTKIKKFTINGLKEFLGQNGIECRI